MSTSSPSESSLPFSLLTQAEAIKVDEELVGEHGFSFEVLMELAGLSVAQALASAYPTSAFARVLVVVGPGNNGGDALVAARHLKHFGYAPTIVYPKQTPKKIYLDLVKQCLALRIPITPELPSRAAIDSGFDLILDGIFGFSFQGEIRAPFDAVIATLKQCQPPIFAIDIPSGWDVEKGNVGERGLDAQALSAMPFPLPSLLLPLFSISFTSTRSLCARAFSSLLIP